MTLQDFGAIGEVVGALGVVVTLVYLTKQIRLNTIAMDEARKLALAQTYQMRSDALQAMMVHAADSEHIGPIIIKLTELGYPEDVTEALEQLTSRRTRSLPPVADRAADALGQHVLPVRTRLPRRRVVRGFVQGARQAPRADVAGAGLMAVRRSFQEEIERLERDPVGFGEGAWQDSRGRATVRDWGVERMSDTARRRSAFRAYHIVLLALLGIATLYEGFDASMLTLASVDVRATLHIGLDEWGTLYAITRARHDCVVLLPDVRGSLRPAHAAADHGRRIRDCERRRRRSCRRRSSSRSGRRSRACS